MSDGKTRLNLVVWLIAAVSLLGGGWHAASAYEAIKVKDGGTVTGIVKFIGISPPPERLEVTRDRKKCGVDVHLSEALVVSATGGIKNAVVSLKEIEKGKAQPKLENNLVLEQEKCWFNPHVLLVPADSTVDLINNDEVMHNIHTVSTINPVVNKTQPSFKKRLRIKLRQPETIRVNCDMHPWMHAWFVVTGHPYYVITDANGGFTLTDIPAGRYALQVWQETLGTQTQAVEVTPNGETNVVFEMKPSAVNP